MKRQSKRLTFAVAGISALGATLTTLVALTDRNAPAYIWEASILAGVTALSVALTHIISSEDKDKDQDE